MPDNAALLYGQNQITMASPAAMVLMLYEKVISSLKEAQRAIESGDIAARCNANCKAMEIIAHLSDTLDMEGGGEIAQNLENIYSFALRHLVDVDMRNDPKPAQDIIKLMEPLADSWRQLADRPAIELAAEMEKARAAATSSAQPAAPATQQPTAPRPPAPQHSPQDPGPDAPPPTGGISISA